MGNNLTICQYNRTEWRIWLNWTGPGIFFCGPVPPPKKKTLVMHINGRAPTKWCLPSWKLRADTARYPGKTEEEPEPIVMRCVFLIRLLGEKRWWRFFFRPNSRAPLFTPPYCRSEVGPNGRKSPKKGGRRQTEIKFFQFFKKEISAQGLFLSFFHSSRFFLLFNDFCQCNAFNRCSDSVCLCRNSTTLFLFVVVVVGIVLVNIIYILVRRRHTLLLL
jgi:hypothetical protein